MNLDKLFQAQKLLRDHIGYQEQDRFEKLNLALLVEVGECANEYRGFKFWSKDQQPRIKKARAPYVDLDDAEFYNPLLEEFVDGFHFVLEEGLELVEYGFLSDLPDEIESADPEENITEQFKHVMYLALLLEQEVKRGHNLTKFRYYQLLANYVALGEMLGFTWEEIEVAYFAKNEVNHQRQDNGY